MGIRPGRDKEVEHTVVHSCIYLRDEGWINAALLFGGPARSGGGKALPIGVAPVETEYEVPKERWRSGDERCKKAMNKMVKSSARNN